MNGKFFIDTNLFAYSFDSSQRKKQRKAQEIIGEALSQKTGIISFQVVQEFLNIAIRKFSKPMTIHDSKHYLGKILYPLCEVFPTESLYTTALDISNETQYSFYDSLIIAAASTGQCKTLYTEDLCHQRMVHGVTIVNPFQ